MLVVWCGSVIIHGVCCIRFCGILCSATYVDTYVACVVVVWKVCVLCSTWCLEYMFNVGCVCSLKAVCMWYLFRRVWCSEVCVYSVCGIWSHEVKMCGQCGIV